MRELKKQGSMITRLIISLLIFFCGFSSIGASEKELKESGVITGILAAKENDWIAVIPDGMHDDFRFFPVWKGGTKSKGGGYDKKTIKAIKGLFVLGKVKVKYKLMEKYRVIDVKMVIPKKRSGRAAGKITAKRDHWIEITTKDGQVDRYMPRWIGHAPAEGGHLDGKILNEIQQLFKGEEIEFNWVYDERKRITKIELGPDSFPLILRGFSGMVKAKVVSKEKKNLIKLKISKVLKIWKDNASEEPWKLEGMTVKVGPNWHKVKGKWRPYERHTTFINKLKKGEELDIELKYGERDVMSILELSQEQRERVAADE